MFKTFLIQVEDERNESSMIRNESDVNHVKCIKYIIFTLFEKIKKIIKVYLCD